MTKRTADEPAARKSISLPLSVWQEIADYRFANRIGSEAEAIRRILQDWLKTRKEQRS